MAPALSCDIPELCDLRDGTLGNTRASSLVDRDRHLPQRFNFFKGDPPREDLIHINERELPGSILWIAHLINNHSERVTVRFLSQLKSFNPEIVRKEKFGAHPPIRSFSSPICRCGNICSFWIQDDRHKTEVRKAGASIVFYKYIELEKNQ